MYYFMNKSKGAISVFLIIILMASFLLGGFFIDASRILVAQRKVRMAANTAARSTLAHYDGNLVGEYGLYAIDGGQVDELFKKYFEMNMTKGMSPDIKMYQYTITDSGASPVSDSKLNNNENLKNQIAEFQKYRAPVNMTLALIGKITQMLDLFNSDNINACEDGVQSAEDFEKEHEQAAKDIQKDAKDIGKGTKDDLKALNKDELSDEDIDEAFRKTENRITAVNNEIDALDGKTNVYIEEQKRAQERVNNTGVGEPPSTEGYTQETNNNDALDKQANDNTGDMREKMSGAEGKLNEAKTSVKVANDWYKTAKEKYETKKAEYEEAKANSGVENNENTIRANEKAKKGFQDTINGYFTVLIGKYFANDNVIKAKDEYKSADKTKRAKIRDWVKNNKDPVNGNTDVEYTDEEKQDLKTIFDSYDDITKLEDENKRLNNEINAENQALADKKKAMDDAKVIMERAKNELDDSIDSIDSKMKVDIGDDSTKLEVQDLEKNTKDSFNTSEVLSKLKNLKDNIEKAGRSMPAADGAAMDEMEDKNSFKMIKSVIEYAKNLVRVCSSPESIRNECYMIDYIMERSTFLTSQSGYNHWFNIAEAEYIIFGCEKQISNIFAAVTSIYTIRFVINTLNYFITSKVPEIVTRIIEAVGRGLVQACIDMKDMLVVPSGADSAPGCGLCPSFDKVKLSYSDHLILLMLLKIGSNEEKLVNTMSSTLKDEKGGKGLNELYTRISCHAEVEVNLIILSMFNLDFPEGGHFRDGKYVIKEEFVDGYQ